jgi:hypothetical protein
VPDRFGSARAPLTLLSDVLLAVGGQPLQAGVPNLRLLSELRGLLLVSVSVDLPVWSEVATPPGIDL